MKIVLYAKGWNRGLSFKFSVTVPLNGIIAAANLRLGRMTGNDVQLRRKDDGHSLKD